MTRLQLAAVEAGIGVGAVPSQPGGLLQGSLEAPPPLVQGCALHLLAMPAPPQPVAAVPELAAAQPQAPGLVVGWRPMGSNCWGLSCAAEKGWAREAAGLVKWCLAAPAHGQQPNRNRGMLFRSLFAAACMQGMQPAQIFSNTIKGHAKGMQREPCRAAMTCIGSAAAVHAELLQACAACTADA